ncbi:hypothetical protein SpCBS45565_g00661 [Spizellomyces sp. 'palustris']|nr:hypothetical protein SpCBS45565_g00661 [Spizellomyces sp. 'palustris']
MTSARSTLKAYRCLSTASKKLVPPFTAETAVAKVKLAEDLWNSRDPNLVALAYTPDSVWRNRAEFLKGRDDIVQFLKRKWAKEQGYKLRKELFCFQENKIAVQFWYEYHDEHKQWYRAHGLEHWTFNEDGLMKERRSSINDLPISDAERWFKGK